MKPELSRDDIRLIRLLQEEFPLCERPFAKLGEALGLPEETVLAMVERLQREDYLKRISVVLFHTHVGFKVNVMVAWDIPEAELNRAAEIIMQIPQVTHCYTRNRTAEFDYNFYTMLHERTEEAYQELLQKMETLLQAKKHCTLRTLRELKKVGMKYFTE